MEPAVETALETSNVTPEISDNAIGETDTYVAQITEPNETPLDKYLAAQGCKLHDVFWGWPLSPSWPLLSLSNHKELTCLISN